ncbi:MAG: hypothetical protein ABSB35_07855 [Bryobacteraceae bacterium]|jgi:hypothetical protein
MSKFASASTLVVGLLLATALNGLAQNPTGVITGTVTDESGAESGFVGTAMAGYACELTSIFTRLPRLLLILQSDKSRQYVASVVLCCF